MYSSVYKILAHCLPIIGLLFLISSPASAKGELSRKQAQKLIARTTGLDLETSAVRVTSLRSVDATAVEAAAEIATAFRFEQIQSGPWRVAEVRTGQDQWQSIELLVQAMKTNSEVGNCDADELQRNGMDPSNRRTRCLLGALLGVQLPSDEVRIVSISPSLVPFGSKSSALVEALITVEFRFTKPAGGAWRVAGVRTGKRTWIDAETLLTAVNDEKSRRARAELDQIAQALDDFRAQRGSYLETKSLRVLIDFLSPRYLVSVIRVDPWLRPYFYEGTRDQFTLRSSGPDGKENTGDDIVLRKPGPSAALPGHF